MPSPTAVGLIAFLALVQLLSLGRFAHAQLDLTYSKAQAHQEFDQSVDEVRRSMDSNPHVAEFALRHKLAGPLGSDPRVLALCREVIEKSTNAESIRAALFSLLWIVQQNTPLKFGGWHSLLFIRRKTASEVHDLLKKGIDHNDFGVRLAAAESLAQFGDWMRDSARDEALQAFRKLTAENHAATETNQAFDVMARYFGDSTEVIKHYGDLLDNSTDPKEARAEFVQIKDIATHYYLGRSEKSHDNRDSLIAIIRKALHSRHQIIQFEAAAFLPKFGSEYVKEARAFLETRLREPISTEGDGPRAAAIQWLILPLVDSSRKEDVELLKAATAQNHLLEFYEVMLSRDSVHNVSSYDQEHLRKWKLALEHD